MAPPKKSVSECIAFFWAHVERSNTGCLVWTGARISDGYGKMRWRGKPRATHRIAFELAHNRVPGPLLRHTCHERLCCDVAHLVEGTHADNRRDMLEAGRENATGPKLPPEKLDAVRERLREGESCLALSRELGISRQNFHKVRDAVLR